MRLFILALVLTSIGTLAGAQELRSAFYALPRADRIVLQERLAEAGLYSGVIDGLYGPGTAAALQTAQDSLAWPGYRATAEAAGVASPFRALWSFISDPDMTAGLAIRR